MNGRVMYSFGTETWIRNKNCKLDKYEIFYQHIQFDSRKFFRVVENICMIKKKYSN